MHAKSEVLKGNTEGIARKDFACLNLSGQIIDDNR